MINWSLESLVEPNFKSKILIYRSMIFIKYVFNFYFIFRQIYFMFNIFFKHIIYRGAEHSELCNLIGNLILNRKFLINMGPKIRILKKLAPIYF